MRSPYAYALGAALVAVEYAHAQQRLAGTYVEQTARCSYLELRQNRSFFIEVYVERLPAPSENRRCTSRHAATGTYEALAGFLTLSGQAGAERWAVARDTLRDAEGRIWLKRSATALMTSMLYELAGAEESWHISHDAYTPSLTDLRFAPRFAVTLTITEASADHYGATATHPATRAVCQIRDSNTPVCR